MNTQNQWWFFFDLKLKAPSDRAVNTRLQDRIKDAFEAGVAYNVRYAGIKQLSIVGTQGNRLQVILHYNKTLPEKVTAKELKLFSQYLAQDKEWHFLSNEKSKLFIPVRIIEMEWHEAQFAISNEIDRSAEDEGARLHGEAYWPAWAEYDYGIDLDGAQNNNAALISLTEEDEISDEQLLSVTQFLISTKDLGSAAAKASKQEVIDEMKQLIWPWAIYGGEK